MNATQMEDLLRDALQARAAEVVEVSHAAPEAPRRANRMRPWLIPLAAAAAVVALLGAVFVGRGAFDDEAGSGPAPAGPGPGPTAAAASDPPAAFLGIRDGALVRYATATGAPTIVVAVNPGTTVSSADIAADGTVYYTIVTINDSSSGQLWRIPPGAAPQVMLDPAEWAPRAVSVRDGTLAVLAGSRSGAPGSALDDSIVLVNAADGSEQRRIAGSSAGGDDLRDLSYLADGRLAVQVRSESGVSTTYVIAPSTAAAFDDGPAIPVDPGWAVSAVASGPDGLVVAFWSGAAVEVNVVDPTSFVSIRTLYQSDDGEVVAALTIDDATGAVLMGRDPRVGGAPADAGSVPLVLLNGEATAVPGLEPQPAPPTDVVRVVGWLA